ncbi:putative AMP-binding enzyme [Rhizodiscina lignyota]|uniref:AMP-binding enzyme n=1 Tax=Rhizodiscina lignyota TaxID=1504668 RepID=A0A9P4IJ82_9PEZI|nr:putative AMP-binding enzyme [Rhizodiscina lignyota]
MAPDADRTFFVPRHSGRNILPCSPLFNRLLRHAGRRPNACAIRDDRAGYEKTYLQLLSDVLSIREELRQTLGPEIVRALDNDEEVYIAVLAAGSYEFTVAMLGAMALGAAVVPLTVVLPVEEAAYFIRKSEAAAVLVQSSVLKLGTALQELMVSTTDPSFRSIPIQNSIDACPLQISDILISTNPYLSENAPGVVIFTSGTTGPPKGSVMRRAFVSDNAQATADHYHITEEDVILHILPVHHATGMGIMFFPFLISGACIEFRAGGFDEVWMWDRWREGVRNPAKRITFFSGVPTIFMRMRRHYQRYLSKLPPAELSEYIAAARQFRAVLCGTSALPQPISQFWTSLMKERIVQRYGATEFGAVFKVHLGDKDVPEGSVGELTPGLDLKLSEGDEGEVLVKSPYMFSKYLRDPAATAKAHDASGYYKTGDIARKEGKYYFIMGRASLDIIKSGGYKISALDIEREILGLPYVSEVMVVGVPDEEFGQRVAALIGLQEEQITDEFLSTHGSNEHVLTINDLRRDLRSRLAGYKLPTLLRVVEGELPKTATGKVMKKILGPKFFPEDYDDVKEVQVWRAPSKVEKVIAAKL